MKWYFKILFMTFGLISLMLSVGAIVFKEDNLTEILLCLIGMVLCMKFSSE